MNGLLKLLVAIACIVVIAGGSYAGWREYQERSAVAEADRLEQERLRSEAEQEALRAAAAAKAASELAVIRKKSNCLDMAAELKLRTANSQSPSSLLDGLRRCVEVGTITADEIPDVRDLL